MFLGSIYGDYGLIHKLEHEATATHCKQHTPIPNPYELELRRFHSNATAHMIDAYQQINRTFAQHINQVRQNISQTKGPWVPFRKSYLAKENELSVQYLEYVSWNISSHMKSFTRESCYTYLDGVESHKTFVPFVIRPKSGVNCNHDVCVVTVTTELRLYQLENLLKSWKGCITLVVYLDKDMRYVIGTMLYSWIPKYHKAITVHFAYKIESPLIPINYLRNLAVITTKAEYILYVDIDLMPSRGLYDKALHYIKHQKATLDNNTAIIFPAFSLQSRDIALPKDKKQMLHLLGNGSAVPFYLQGYPPAYGPTNYEKWQNASTSYSVHPNCYDEFEPYLLLRHRYLLYPEIFIHRFINKAIFYTELCLRQFRFLVDPTEFLAHAPHSNDGTSGIVSQRYNVMHCANLSYKLHYERYNDLLKFDDTPLAKMQYRKD